MIIPLTASPPRPARLGAFRRALAIAALPVLLIGCSVGDDYQKPATPTPEGWLSKAAPADWPATDWWRGFKSATLDSYIDQAKQANFDLAAAMARIREADAQAEIAGAPLFPSIGANANVTHERASSGAGLKTFTSYAPGLTASYELDFWGKNRAAAEAAQQTAIASRFDQVTVELTVLTGVSNTYFQALAFRDRLAVAEENVASAQVILKGLELQEQTGIANALDVAQQQTTVSTLNAAIPPLRQQLQQNLDALSILLGEPAQSVQLAQASLRDFAFPAVAPGLPSELLARRPDVAEAEAQLKSANANITVARAAFFPSITLTGSGGFASTALSSAFNPSNGIFAIGAGLVQPIFEGGALEGQLENTKARYDELVADYRKSVISAFGNVQDALTGVQQTTDQLSRQEAAEAAAQRAYDIAQAQLRAGTINILTVLNTETALFSARDATVQARLARLQSLVSLFNALGGGWQQN